MSVEYCSNFRRYVNFKIPPPNVITTCMAKQVPVACRGWSNDCEYPELFIPAIAQPARGTITFKK